MSDERALVEAAQEAVALARKDGADEVEAYVGTLDGLSIAHHGALAYVREINESGIAVRVVIGRRASIASVEGSTPEARRRAVAKAIARARATPEASVVPSFAEPASLAPPTRVHPALAARDEDAQTRDAAAISRALAEAPAVTFHESALTTYDQSFAIANSRGVVAWDRDVIQLLQAEARVTRGGVSRTTADVVCSDAPVSERADLDAFARRIVERAALATDAKPLPRAVDEAILAPIAAGQILRLWTPSLAGEADGPYAHPRAKPVGDAVASPALTLVDAPRSAGGPRRQRVDDEGSPARDTTLVERGILKTRMTNATIAARQGVPSTGNAYRPLVGRWGKAPSIGPANVHVRPGSKSLDELIAGMDRGVVLTDRLMGAFVASDRTGDFSLLASTCFYVERGSVQHALPSATIGGDAHEIVRGILAVGREAGHTLEGTIPPLHVRGVACAT